MVLPARTSSQADGWNGDRLVHTERVQEGQGTRQLKHTIYEPGSFVPLIRIEGSKAPPGHTLVQKLQESGNTIDGKTRAILEGLEQELRQDNLSPVSQQWMRQARLQPETLKAMLDEKPPGREQQIHLYHCDHLGTPLALIDPQGRIAWAARVGPWGNVIATYNPENLNQPIRLPGQHEDEESGLYYNRHRYYDAANGNYINQDPISLSGGSNLYSYVLDPILWMDATGTSGWSSVPIFNGSLPGNQVALGKAMGGGAPVSQYSPRIYTKSSEGLTCTIRFGVGVGVGVGLTVSYNTESGLKYVGIGPQVGASASITGLGAEAIIGEGAHGVIIQGSASAGNGLLGINSKAAAGIGGASASMSPGVGIIGISVGATVGYAP